MADNHIIDSITDAVARGGGMQNPTQVYSQLALPNPQCMMQSMCETRAEGVLPLKMHLRERLVFCWPCGTKLRIAIEVDGRTLLAYDLSGAMHPMRWCLQF